jgi:hypothetical protein
MSAGLRSIDRVGAFSLLGCFPSRHVLRSNVDSGNRVEEPKNIQDPKNYRNDHDAVQNGLDGSLHWNEAIHQPQKNTHHDENFQELN